MSATRRRLLGAILVSLGLLSAAILFDVLGTVFFAITLAYVLAPLHRRLVERGLSPWLASAAASAVAFFGVALLFVPVGGILYRRRGLVFDVLRDLPSSVTVGLFGYSYAVETGAVLDVLVDYLSQFAIAVARATPVLAVKFVLLVIVVFGLLGQRSRLRSSLLAPVPAAYHDIVEAFHVRVREVLFAIYVLQAATAAGTFVVAWPLFAALGYDSAGTIAAVAAVLQFVPIVGPSVLVVALAAFELSVGSTVKALLVLVLGLGLVAGLPDLLIRPRLAQHTAHLPGSLYFVGFTGGLLSLGAVGVIAGPLVVALLAESVRLLAVETAGE